MKISKEGVIELISHEAIVLNPYKDSVGVWTIAAGQTKASLGYDPREHEFLTIKEAVEIFEKTLPIYELEVSRAFTRPLAQCQFDAATSFHWNTGRIRTAGWVKHVNSGRYDTAEHSTWSGIMAWRKPKEIIGRREKERDLFFHGKYTNDGTTTVYHADRQGRVLWGSAKKTLLYV